MKRQKTRTQREELGLALRALAVLRTPARIHFSAAPARRRDRRGCPAFSENGVVR